MGRIEGKPTVGGEITIRLAEAEARALMALVAYGDKAFLKVFYEHMGESCLRPHQVGLIGLFDTVRGELPSFLRRVDAARKAFTE